MWILIIDLKITSRITKVILFSPVFGVIIINNLRLFMPNNQKKQQVKLIKEKIEQAKSVVFIDYSGTDAKEQVVFRSKVKEAGGEVFVAKNTLINIALDKKELKDVLSGMTALVLSYDDAVSGLKQIVEFHDDTKKLVIKKGFMPASKDQEERILSLEQVIKLSKLPGKQELMSSLISKIKAPSYGLVNVLNANTRDLINVLKEISKKNK